MMALLISVFIVIGIMDVKTILKGKSQKTYVLYFSLLLLGFTINILIVLDKVPMNNPITIIEKIIKIFIN